MRTEPSPNLNLEKRHKSDILVAGKDSHPTKAELGGGHQLLSWSLSLVVFIVQVSFILSSPLP
ncbi:unnamed protein product [Coffea canephora]|uniref:DH200=94 genomic scaffold, scaffold_2601 n=1 Tax=Coffea canephora TaxID=49390 RepID=A0A068VKC0_COFCA|nr:unnamed protein product [Coffea canephora]